MAQIKWKSKTETDAEKAAAEAVKAEKEKYKGMDASKLKQDEINELVVIMAKERGIL